MKYKRLLGSILFLSTSILGQTQSNWIHFDWHAETIFGKYYPKVAMSIPLKIENLPYAFCGQLDLGATKTMIYENSFKHFAQKYPSVIQKLDTTISPFYLNGRKSFFLKRLSIQLDKTRFLNRNIALIPEYGDDIPVDSMNTKSQKLIGTIAPDLFQDKVLVIDFEKNRLNAFDKLPLVYQKANFVPALIQKGRIKIPVEIGDTTYYVMFDTGNCLGDLLLDKETILSFTDSNEPAQEFLNGKTWGQPLVYYNKNLKQKLYFNGREMGIQKAQFSDQDSDVQFNKEEKIIGLIGPVLFQDKVVIIDYRNKRFGVL